MTEPLKPAGEELDLLSIGETPTNSDQKPAVTKEQKKDDIPNMGARVGNMQGMLSPSTTDQQVVDAIIEAPEDQLIPWEICKLPSLGLYYGWSEPYCKVRAMGQAADKILATQRLAQSGQSIDYLFNKCCRFPNTPSGEPFESLDLIAGDRIFLLYYLRAITHGNIYEFAVTCQRPDCQHTSTHSYDLNELASTIKWADPALGLEPFKVILPYVSKAMGRDVWVGLRFIRGRDMNNLVAMKRMNKKVFAQSTVRAGRPSKRTTQNTEPIVDETLSENIQLVIHNINGVTDRSKINAFVERMHSTDTSAIREWLRVNSPGIETTVSMTCPECGQEFKTELPITESFFRPTQGG